MKRPAAYLVVSCLCTAVAHLWMPIAPSITTDESFTWRMVNYEFAEMILKLRDDVHPPGYYLIAKLWRCLFGDDILALRALSSLCAIMVAVGCGILASMCVGRCRRTEAGLVAAVFASFSWTQILPGSTARMYAVGSMFVVYASIFWLRYLRTRQPSDLVWALGTGVAAVYTHYFTVFSVATALFCSVVQLRSSRRSQGRVSWPSTVESCCWLAATVAVLPLIAFMAPQLKRVTEWYWIPTESWRQAIATVAESWTGMDGLGLSAFVMVGVMGIGLVTVFIRQNARFECLYLVLLTIGPRCLAFLFEYFTDRPTVVLRALTFSQCFVTVFFAAAITRVNDAVLRRILISTIATVLVIATVDRMSRLVIENSMAPIAERLVPMLQPEDQAIVAYPSDVNRLRYEFSRSQDTDFRNVRWPGQLNNRVGQVNHVAALSLSDLFDVNRVTTKRVWVVKDQHFYPHLAFPNGWTLSKEINNVPESSYSAKLYESKCD